MPVKAEQDFELVAGVEDGLLVLLEVAVVRERESLQRGHQAGQVADQTPGLAAGQLGDVRVLLLRHDRRAGGEGVVEGDEGELLRVPDDDLLGDPGEVDADHRGDERELGDEVAGGRAVDGVGDGTVLEAEVRGDRLRVETERRTGERAGAVRGDGRTLVPLPQPLGVPGQRLHMGQDVVGEEDGLGVLQMRTARHGDVRVRLGETDQGVLELGDQAADDPGVVAQIHPEERGDLVVAGPAGRAACRRGPGRRAQ